jgi:hypothetical protein
MMTFPRLLFFKEKTKMGARKLDEGGAVPTVPPTLVKFVFNSGIIGFGKCFGCNTTLPLLIAFTAPAGVKQRIARLVFRFDSLFSRTKVSLHLIDGIVLFPSTGTATTANADDGSG